MPRAEHVQHKPVGVRASLHQIAHNTFAPFHGACVAHVPLHTKTTNTALSTPRDCHAGITIDDVRLCSQTITQRDRADEFETMRHFIQHMM